MRGGALFVLSLVVVGCAGAGTESARPVAVPPASAIPVRPEIASESATPETVAAPRPVRAVPEAIAAPTSPPTADGDAAPSPPLLPPPSDEDSARATDSPGEPAAAANIQVSVIDEPPFRRASAELPEPNASERKHSKKRGHHRRPYHPAPGIIVDVVEARGGTSAAELQRVARNIGYWPFRHCYQEGLRRDQELGGKVPLEMVVGPSGDVQRVEAMGATLTDPSVVTCVAREALHLSLVPSETSTETKLVVTLAKGDEPVPLPRPVVGASDLRQVLQARLPDVEQCYLAGLSKHPDGGGRLELRFRVDSTGQVADVKEGETRFSDIDVTRCVLGIYRTTKLPARRTSGKDASFVYAMHLEPRSNVLPVR